MKHIFPFADINRGEKIILYGASQRGYDFYRQLVSTGYDEIVLWVDRQYEWYKYMNLPVEAPEKICETEYDRIVITAEEEGVYKSILSDLFALGIREADIYWKKDCLITGNIASGYDQTRMKKESERAYLKDPRELIGENRLDIVIRVMYAKDQLTGKNLALHRDMYKKLMMMQNNGTEPTDNMLSGFFSEYAVKSGWKAFDNSFRELLDSMSAEGFVKEYFIPLDRAGRMINGAHRVAAAAALGMMAWVLEYPVYIKPLIFDETWLGDNGFTAEEISHVWEGLRELVK